MTGYLAFFFMQSRDGETPKSKDRGMKRHRMPTEGETSSSREDATGERSSSAELYHRNAAGQSGPTNKSADVIRNPFLRPVKRPKSKKKAR